MIELGEIKVLKVEFFDWGWVPYQGPNPAVALEGFCPIHQIELQLCLRCAPPGTQRICLECQAENGNHSFHWRARVEYAQAYLGPVK